MTKPFSNDLAPGEAERLAILAEECGEVIQAIGKVLRHGYGSRHPSGGPTNRDTLERELGDLHAAVELMIYAMDLDPKALAMQQNVKWQQLKLWTHHQGGVL